MILGAGGAARAIISAMLQEGAPEVIIANRTRSRAEALKSHFGGKVSVIDWTQSKTRLNEVSTLVNTTSLGMTGKEELRFPLDNLPRTSLVTDIVYTPLETQLLKDAAVAGCQTVDGVGMLLHQATPGFERWFGYAPQVDEALKHAVLG